MQRHASASRRRSPVRSGRWASTRAPAGCSPRVGRPRASTAKQSTAWGGRASVPTSRAHLTYGEWLRREGRRVDARAQLHAAHQLFVTIGMEAFAERTRVELQATGERLRRRTNETRDDLTPHERQIAQLACDGLSNPEIGAQLFLSPRTVEWHLRKVFGKLGIRSRRELPQALPSLVSKLVPA
jgi:DNA-binding CsgD family transcriptional regulator